MLISMYYVYVFVGSKCNYYLTYYSGMFITTCRLYHVNLTCTVYSHTLYIVTLHIQIFIVFVSLVCVYYGGVGAVWMGYKNAGI